MRPPVPDLVGMKFGRLTVIRKASDGSVSRAKWLCRCDCGKEKSVLGSNLRHGRTLSCGCFRSETAIAQQTKHGRSDTRLYGIWTNMKTRCYNSKSKAFKDYGARGITICAEWKNDFQAFYDWAMANGYADSLTIDRIENDKGYSPENCRWATAKEQSNNKRSNHQIVCDGEAHTISEWADITGIQYHTIKQRVNKLGWEAEKALSV